MPFTIVRQDITKMKVDAVVNAANTDLQMGGGVCGAIFKAAGARQLQDACDAIAPIKTGEAAITPGFNLPAKFIIHAVGPIYRLQNAEQGEALLRAAYLNALQLAVEYNCESIAFPLISSGIYGYPKDGALRVASSVIQAFLADHEMQIYLAVFDKVAFIVSERLFGQVSSYIDEHYVREHQFLKRDLINSEREALDKIEIRRPHALKSQIPADADESPAVSIDDLIGNLDKSFSTMLLHLIDAKGKTDTEVYKRANIDRRLFSKIRSDKSYTPSKNTVLALAISLELTLSETNDLLRRAGYALSHSRKFDIIIEYFITSKNYDIFVINEILFEYNQPLLGA
ncbi:MAG: macro domain-containing protein [Anaerolineae bacterium]|nr:macro domain-containing protein [Anaerolineae bacterium]